MKVYKMTLLAYDFEDHGLGAIKDELANRHFPFVIVKTQAAEIGEFSDEHPLNHPGKIEEEMERIFPTYPK